MDILGSVPPLPLAMVYFAVLAVVGTSTWIVWRRLRRLPPDVLRLRLFREFRKVNRSYLSIGLGSIFGMLSLGPNMLGIATPVLWYVAAFAAWTVGLSYGFLTMARLTSEGLPGRVR